MLENMMPSIIPPDSKYDSTYNSNIPQQIAKPRLLNDLMGPRVDMILDVVLARKLISCADKLLLISFIADLQAGILAESLSRSLGGLLTVWLT